MGMYMVGEIARALGRVFIFAVLGLIGVLLAKKTKAAWIPYGLGLLFQIMSFSGARISNEIMGYSYSLGDYIGFVFAVVLAVLFFILILKRLKLIANTDKKQEDVNEIQTHADSDTAAEE